MSLRGFAISQSQKVCAGGLFYKLIPYWFIECEFTLSTSNKRKNFLFV